MPEHPTDAHFSFTFVFKQALKNVDGMRLVITASERRCSDSTRALGAAPFQGGDTESRTLSTCEKFIDRLPFWKIPGAFAIGSHWQQRED